MIKVENDAFLSLFYFIPGAKVDNNSTNSNSNNKLTCMTLVYTETGNISNFIISMSALLGLASLKWELKRQILKWALFPAQCHII